MSTPIGVQRPGAGEFGDGSPADQYMWIDDLTVATGRLASPLAYVIAGHERHHVAILRERYGVGTPSAS